MDLLAKELTEHILLKSLVTTRGISGAKRVLEQEQRNKDESGFSSTSTQVTTNYQTVTSTYDQTTYIVLTSVCAHWRHILTPVSQIKLLNRASLRSNTAVARSNLGK